MRQPADDSVLDRAREAMDRKAWDEAYGLLSEADKAAGSMGRTPDARGYRIHGGPSGGRHRRLGACSRDGCSCRRGRTGGRRGRPGGNPAPVHRTPGTRTRVDPASRSLLVDHPDSPVHGQLAVVLAWTTVLAGDLDEALQHARRAVDVGTSSGIPAIRVLGRNAEARILVFQGHLQEGLAVLDETAVAALSGEAGSP